MAVKKFRDFVVRLATTADAVALRPLLRYVLATEPSGAVSLMTPSDFDLLADLSTTAMPATRRMWVMEAPDGRIVSFVACTDITNRGAPPHVDAIMGNKYGRIDEMEAVMMETYFRKAGYTSETMPAGHSAYLDVGGTLPEFSRMGLNKALHQQLLEDSADRGFLYVGSLTYNKHTLAIAKTVPGVEILHVEDLANWTDNKEKLAKLQASGNDKVALVQQTVMKP